MTYKVAMDIDSLKAFVTVARTASFSNAAKELYLTQPAVSKRIAALETHLNHSLFDRLGKEVSLTETGEALLPQAEKILLSIEETERNIRERSGEIVGSLRVATSHHIGLHHLPPVLRVFASRHKNVNLQFEFLDSEQAHDKVLKGECEMAIVTLDPKISPPLQAKALWLDQLCFVASKEHPFTRHENLSLKTLSEEPAILPDLNTFTGRLVKERFDEANLRLTLNMATNYLETIRMMVSVGLGWSVLPLSLINDQMCILQVSGVHIERTLGVVTHQKRSLGNAARALYQLLNEHRDT